MTKFGHLNFHNNIKRQVPIEMKYLAGLLINPSVVRKDHYTRLNRLFLCDRCTEFSFAIVDIKS